MEIKINIPPYSYGSNTTSLFRDNKNNIYFSTDLEYKSKGGEDIYWFKDTTSKPIPENLSIINTDCDESYFFKDDEENYFFSRKCTDNWDIYKYNLKTKKLIKLPYPINTKWDDFGYYSRNNDIFITSNRGKGKFDIYHIKKLNK